MKNWTEDNLKAQGYRIANCQITSADISMRDHGCLVMDLSLEGQVNLIYGGYVLGKGYLGANDDFFEGSAAGLEYIMRIMDIAGVEDFKSLKGRYIRVAHKGLSHCVTIIGNITKDKWFDAETFFEDKKNDT